MSSESPRELGTEHTSLPAASRDAWRAVKAALKAQRQSPPLVPVSRHGPLPLSFAQQRLWFLSQIDPHSPAYNMPMDYHVSGPLNIPALERSLNEIVSRHEVLRTTFPTINGQAVQIIAASQNVAFPIIDLAHFEGYEQDMEVQRIADNEAQRPIDLANGPLLRAHLLRLGQNEHILLLTIHHIVCDFWSRVLFNRELEHLYGAYRAGSGSPLPAMPIQYADFASWQRDWLSGPVREQQLTYWTQRLSGAPPSTDLPTDHPRPPIPTGRGAKQLLSFPSELTESVRTLNQRDGLTTFMVLLAAFQALIRRYSGQNDILVGSVITDRNRPELNNLIGFFANTLVLRSDLAGDPTFSELLVLVRESVLGAYAHPDLPFELLVEEIQPERDLSRAPLFQIMFVFQNKPDKTLELPGLTVKKLDADRGTTRYDLTLSIQENLDGLTGLLDYPLDLFEPSTMARMAGHFQTLLAGAVARPNLRLSELPILTEPEHRQLISEWNETHAEYPLDKCLHQIIEAQAAKTPNATAVVFQDQRLTYGELNARANQLARHLIKLGVGPDILVGLCLERSLELIVGILGILKAGGAYLPLDPTYPKDRLSYMLSDTNASVLVTQQSLVDYLPEHAAQIVCLDSGWDTIAQEPDLAPQTLVTPDNLAYIIYTSGSTGRPKGVMVPHRGICNLAQAQAGIFKVEPSDRVLQFASLSFDASVFEIAMALHCGAALYLTPQNILQSEHGLGQLLRDDEITNVTLAPTALAALPREPLPALRTIIVAGEACPPELAAYWAKGRNFFDAYGPTEATVWATTALCPADGAKPLIGRPIGNAEIYLLDKDLRPVPIGVPGEIFIGGVGLARGYWGRPDLTAAQFIPNPFSPAPGARLYRTGDLARYLPDGNLDSLGRIDHQVKIRGFRIELGEIEAALNAHDTVREAVVLAREDLPGVKRLVAYLAVNGANALSVGDARRFLKDRLPEYMVPSAFVLLPALPLLPNGKVDRKALPAPDGQRPELDSAFALPTTDAEQILAGIWQDVLRVENIGIHDNFFEIGGDSILSIQVIARAGRAGLRLTPQQMFQHQTIAGLAAVAGTTSAVAAEQGMVTGDVPLTPIQHWFFGLNLPNASHFNQAMRFTAHRPLDPALMRRAVEQLTVQHDALRLRIEELPSGRRQFHAAPEENAVFRYIDLSDTPLFEQASAIAVIESELQESLCLASGPLLGAALVHPGVGRPDQLLIAVHHLAVDAVSWRILLEDLQTGYQQLSQDLDIALPAKTTSFQQWAARLSHYAQSPELAVEKAFWLSRPWPLVAPLPRDYAGAANTVDSVARVSSALTADETRLLLREVPAKYRTQMNDVLLTALLQALTPWTGTQHVLVDLEGHGREDLFSDIDLSRTVGWFTTLYPVVLECNKSIGPGGALMAVKEQLHAIPQRGLGYGVLRYLSGPEIRASLGTLPTPEISFNYLGQFDQLLSEDALLELAPQGLVLSQDTRGPRPHLLSVVSSIVAGQLQIGWSYSTAVHKSETIEALVARYMASLRALIAHCQSEDAGGYTPSDFPLAGLSQEDLDDVLADLA